MKKKNSSKNSSLNLRLCGQTKGVENAPYLLFFDLTRCISVVATIAGCPTTQICVKSCPSENLYEKISDHKNKIQKEFFFVYLNFTFSSKFFCIKLF